VFTALAFWSTIHLTVRMIFFFKHYKGLYFWALIITSWCLSIRAIGFLFKFEVPSINWIFSTILAEAGWIGMVTGFSIVLWSRLNIIVEDRRIIYGVLAMILINGFIWHSALVVLQFGLAGSHGANRDVWLRIVNPMERTQITMFTVQEVIISGIYIHATYRILDDRIFKQSERTRKVMLMLFVVQTIAILMDVAIITLDLAGYFTLKAIIHSWAYGIKLELEFVVLNQLKETANSGVPGLISVPNSQTDASLDTGGQSSPSTLIEKKPGSNKDWWDNPSYVKQPSQAPLPSPNATRMDLEAALKLDNTDEGEAAMHRTPSSDRISVIPDD
jgi:hypothetical protein